MSNTLTNINTTKVQAEILAALTCGLTPLNAFSLSVGGDPSEKNGTVTVPLATARTADTNATDYEDGNSTIVGYDVALSTNLSSCWHMTAIQASKTGTDAFAALARESAYAVALAAQNAAFNLITNAHYTNGGSVASGSAMDVDKLQDLRSACLVLGMRAEKISVVLDTAYFTGLMKDPAMRDKSASGADVALTGVAARIAGMSIYESVAIESSTPYGTPTLRGFLNVPDALALAIRPPAVLPGGPYEVNEIISLESGIAANYRQWVAPQTNTLWGCVEILFGGDCVNAAGLYRIYV